MIYLMFFRIVHIHFQKLNFFKFHDNSLIVTEVSDFSIMHIMHIMRQYNAIHVN